MFEEVFRSNISEDGFDGVKNDILEDLNAGNEVGIKYSIKTVKLLRRCLAS